MSALEVDLLIVGAGPVGLFGAYYAGVRGLRTAVADSLSQVGGQVSAMYPEKLIYDVAGFPAVSGRRLIANLVEQAAPYEPVYLLGQEAQRLDRVPRDDGRPDLLVVKTSAGTEITAGAVIVTGGIGTFTPRPLPAGEEFLGRGLEYFVPDSTDYAGKDVVVVGGGTSAIGFLLELEGVAASLTWATRRPVDFRDESELTIEGGVAAVAMQDAAARAGEALPSIVSGTGVPRTRRIAAGIERGLLVERPMFTRVEEHGVRWPDGSFTQADAIIWATGFRPELRHLAPLKLREKAGGLTVASAASWQDSRIFLAGYGPQASTIGANRAGRIIARQIMAQL